MRRPRSELVIALVPACWLGSSSPSSSCPDDRVVVLTAQTEVDRFAACERAIGVAIHGFEALDTGKLAVARIDGDLVIGPSTSNEQIAASELREVTGSVTILGNGLLRDVFLPRLQRAGRIAVDGNDSLATLSLPSLVEVTGGVAITDNKELTLVDASALATIGKGLVLQNAPRLATVVAPSLTSAQTVTIDAVPKLPIGTIAALQSKAVP
jgi:hypothetical protein